MQIEKMSIDDYDKVYAVWTVCHGMSLNNLDDTKDGISKFLARNPETCFVAKNNDMIIGAIIVGNDGRRGYIYHTAVLPEYQKQGIGKALVETSVDSLKTLGINKVALVVFSKNKSGNEFWERVGFTAREDLVYRNKTIKEFVRFDT